MNIVFLSFFFVYFLFNQGMIIIITYTKARKLEPKVAYLDILPYSRAL